MCAQAIWSNLNNFKDYFTRHNQVIYENPSPGNKKGGITTLEEYVVKYIDHQPPTVEATAESTDC